MNLKCLTWILSVAVAASAQAGINLSGLWKGPGLISAAGGNLSCLASLRVQQSETDLTLDSRKFTCDGVDYDWQGLHFIVQGSQLFLDKTLVGVIGADGLKAEWKSADQEVVWNLVFEMKNGKLHYQYTKSYRDQFALQQATLEKK